jgi:hypothetical protein
MISEAYQRKITEYHKTHLWGGAVEGKAFEIECIAKDNGCSTILDFGCGFGALKNKIGHKLQVTEYDAGIEGKNKLPAGKFDMVVCCDVMEHVEPMFVDQTIDWLYYYATNMIYVSICCAPSLETFDDGSNLHLTIQTPSWWMSRFEERGSKFSYVGTDRGLTMKVKV